ncbi:putative proline-rich receptor-like protein kinase PERK6 [Aricia agestis]|uniref:putative proline-rich receptor-like protein kinase PERK6 n=1 Tax=Aricia agestis TaxID=91739 RepID=UPI001C208076|nr:putative proline-rich receptor-like protein kinase PERK6 [Aricia agestis]
MNCKYYCDRFLGWVFNNKIIVFLSLLCFCLFVSTLAMAGQRNRLSNELSDLTSTTTTTTTPQPETGDNNTVTDGGTEDNNTGNNNTDTDNIITGENNAGGNNNTDTDDSSNGHSEIDEGNTDTEDDESSAGSAPSNPNSPEAEPNARNVEESKPEEHALLEPSRNIGLDSNLLQILAGGA